MSPYVRISDKQALVYIDGRPANHKLYPQLLKHICSLANTRGGSISIVRKNRNGKTPYSFIPKKDLDLYRDTVRSVLNDIRGILQYDPIDSWGVDGVSSQNGEYNDYQITINVAEYKDGLLSYENRPGSSSISRMIPYRDKDGRVLVYSSKKRVDDLETKELKQRLNSPNAEMVTKSGKKYKTINIESPASRAYKYMTLDAFVSCMSEGTLRLVEPTKWQDEYEGRFYHADYKKNLSVPDSETPAVYATCITENAASEAAWKVYSHGIGLGARCVQIKLNLDELRDQLSEKITVKKKMKGKTEIIEYSGDLYEGKVFYDLSNDEINDLHRTGKPFHALFFSGFNLDKFLRLLLLKRQAYKHENEIRLFFIKNPIEVIGKSRKGKAMDVIVDWAKIIEEINYDSGCTSSELLALKHSCQLAGIKCTDQSKRGPKKKGLIPLNRFDVDKMAGKKRIDIQK